MRAKAINPILNVSNLEQSFEWFESLGWEKKWDWGDPASFGSVGSGECEIFLCQDGQGGRGKGDNTSTFGPGGNETKDKGSWMSIWVDNVDDIYAMALESGIEVVFPPEDLPWGVRECHLRHPDGHVLRISQ
ncbi:MAG: bleomycin resistance family protein [Gammaproteobacteria bacterium]|nr:bleomycin resistance family protein [Gammaproteobacteria bacterium]